jgi:Icc-related predicted phosphoesterase
MKLLLFSDIHTNKDYALNLVKMSEDADIVIGAGDYGSLRRNIKKTIQWLSSINKPTILVPGNAESYEELKEACEQWPYATVLHGTGIEKLGINFFGIGGGIPVTPFGSWSYDFSEEQAEDLLKECPENAVLISHSPPLGILDTSSSGKHLGSETIRKIIFEKTPHLLVCGHIHESGGLCEKIGKTVVINAGPSGIFYELNFSEN